MSTITKVYEPTVTLHDHMGDDKSIINSMLVSTCADDGGSDIGGSHRRKEKLADADIAYLNDPSIVNEAYGLKLLDNKDYLDYLVARYSGGDPDFNIAKMIGRINYLMKNEHGSPFEHNGMTFRVYAPLFTINQWVRHRTQSYNIQSGRYGEYEPEIYFCPEYRPLVQVGKPGAYEFEPMEQEPYLKGIEIQTQIWEAEMQAYQDLLNIGWPKEIARGHLGSAMMSSMYVTMNLRAALKFLSLRRFNNVKGDRRTKSHAQFEIDLCAKRIEEYVEDLFPIAYETFVANNRVSP